MKIVALVRTAAPAPSAEELSVPDPNITLAAWAVTDEELWPALLRAAQKSDWIWMLGERIRPRLDALSALLVHGQNQEPPRGLLCGTVIDENGVPVPQLLGRTPEDQPERVLAAVMTRTLPVRWAPFAHALVDRRVVLAHGVPDPVRFGPFAFVEWSARVARAEGGLLVPASTAVLTGAGHRITRPSMTRLTLSAARVTREDAWLRAEAIRAVYEAIRGSPA